MFNFSASALLKGLEEEANLYRALCIYTFIGHPLFHWIYTATISNAFDPLMHRMILSGLAIGAVILEHFYIIRKKVFINLCIFLVHLNNVWFIYLMHMNHYLPEYITGYFIILIACSFSFEKLRNLTTFIGITFVLLGISFKVIDHTWVHPIPTYAIIASVFMLAYIMLYLKITYKRFLAERNTELKEKNKEILDSIKYAQRIQRAILPSDETVKSLLPEYFVMYMPKDIVSGDFYYVDQKKDKTIFAVVDCTGHGVPGAFMSIVGHNGLTYAIKERELTTPSEILNNLNESVLKTLKRSNYDVQDGMDVSLCTFKYLDNDKIKLEFAGAFHSVYIVTPLNSDDTAVKFSKVISNEKYSLIEIKGNRFPIGTQNEEEVSFDNHTITFSKGDMVYVFSDGFADQFGGPEGKKFKYQQFKEVLLSIQQRSMEIQKKILEERYAEWKGNRDQVDDVCVIGIRF